MIDLILPNGERMSVPTEAQADYLCKRHKFKRADEVKAAPRKKAPKKAEATEVVSNGDS